MVRLHPDTTELIHAAANLRHQLFARRDALREELAALNAALGEPMAGPARAASVRPNAGQTAPVVAAAPMPLGGPRVKGELCSPFTKQVVAAVAAAPGATTDQIVKSIGLNPGSELDLRRVRYALTELSRRTWLRREGIRGSHTYFPGAMAIK